LSALFGCVGFSAGADAGDGAGAAADSD